MAPAALGEVERVRAGRIRDERRRLGRGRGLALAARDVRVAAGRGDLVVVALEGAVAREGVVPRVRGRLVRLERRGPGGAPVEGALVVRVDHRRVERALARLVPLAIRDVDRAARAD